MPADKPEREPPISLRLHTDVLGRVERVRAAIERATGLAPAVVATRHGVLLAALLAGLDDLEARYGLRTDRPDRARRGRRGQP